MPHFIRTIYQKLFTKHRGHARIWIMKKKGLAGGLLLALLLSACSKGVDVPGTTPRDRAERDEREKRQRTAGMKNLQKRQRTAGRKSLQERQRTEAHSRKRRPERMPANGRMQMMFHPEMTGLPGKPVSSAPMWIPSTAAIFSRATSPSRGSCTMSQRMRRSCTRKCSLTCAVRWALTMMIPMSGSWRMRSRI